MEQAPPPPMPDPQAIQDAEHIRLLVIFHYIWAGLLALCGFFPIIYLALGLAMLGGSIPSSPGTSPEELRMVGTMFSIIGALGTVIVWAMAALSFFAGKFLSQRRRPTFILVISCIDCLSMPLGTALGVFTILVTQRPSVKALFDGSSAGLGSFR
jgi:vacuolar-type H+-ATPase subunit I/STV1